MTDEPNKLRKTVFAMRTGVVAVATVWWIAFGLFLYLSAKRRGKPRDDIASSPAIIIIWPFLFVLRGLDGVMLLMMPVGILSIGYLFGYKLGHPWIGAVLGAMIPAVLIGLGYRRR